MAHTISHNSWLLLLPLEITLAQLCAALAAATVLYYAARSVYYVFFHPLASVPGPLLHKLSIVPFTLHELQNRSPFHALELHERYGAVVRIAPNHLSFADPQALRVIYTSHSFPKHPMYRLFDLAGEQHTFSTTDVELSKKRKRMLRPVFALPTIASLEEMIHEIGPKRTADALIRRFNGSSANNSSSDSSSNSDRHHGMEVDLYHTFFDMTFSVIGRLAFGETFDTARYTDDYDAVDLIKALDEAIGMQYLIPSVFHSFLTNVAKFTPFVRMQQLVDFADRCVSDKYAAKAAADASGKPPPNDILQMMIDARDPEDNNNASLSHSALCAEALVLAFAGTDTSASTLTWTFDLLFANLDCLYKLEQEILAAFPLASAGERITYREAKELKYLDAVLLESMRMRAVGGPMLSRVVPPGGRTICGVFVPGGTAVGMSSQAFHNWSALWDEPNVFKPERFIVDESDPDRSADAVAARRQIVTPFGTGVRSCIGRQLAMVELVVGLATMIQRFQIRPVLNERGEYTPLEPACQFVLAPVEKSLKAIISPRSI